MSVEEALGTGEHGDEGHRDGDVGTDRQKDIGMGTEGQRTGGQEDVGQQEVMSSAHCCSVQPWERRFTSYKRIS